jgi:hypothetical protein
VRESPSSEQGRAKSALTHFRRTPSLASGLLMIRARLRALLDALLEPLGYRRVILCEECGRWFPQEGPDNWYSHVFGALL